MKYNSILETIGNTPVVKIGRLYGAQFEVWIKLERSNPGGSIKDRIAFAMVEDAERRGILKPGATIVEPTSGNTGIGLAMVAASKGYSLILTMPESMSIERRKIATILGAKIILTPKEGGMRASIARANELLAEIPNSWMPSQFDNPANVTIHRETTAKELEADFPQGFDLLITGVGTGGHISGCGQYLKPRFPKLKVFAVEPDKSPVISGGTHTPHRLQGIGAGFIPENLDRDQLDGVITVSEEDAFTYARRMAREEGILVGLSSGATLAAIGKHIAEGNVAQGTRIVGFCYDTGERYLSIDQFSE
jgi:cysteine synthase A